MGYPTSFVGFNAERTPNNAAWSLNSDGAHNGGAIVFGDINGGLSLVTIPTLAQGQGGENSQTVGNDAIRPNVRLRVTGDGRVGIGTTIHEYQLTVNAPSTHLQLRRGATETTGGKQLFLELFQEEGPQDPVYPSIRFHHGNKFWNRLEVRMDGFHFKEGNLNGDSYVPIYAGSGFFSGAIGIGTPGSTEKLDVNGNINLSGKVKQNGKEILHIVGIQRVVQGNPAAMVWGAVGSHHIDTPVSQMDPSGQSLRIYYE